MNILLKHTRALTENASFAEKPGQRAHHISVSVCLSMEEFRALEPEWRALEALCRDICLFQSYDWCGNYLDHMEAIEAPDIRIVCARNAGQLIAVLPLAISKNRGAKVLTGLSEPFQQYTEMLLAPGFQQQPVFCAMLDEIGKCDADYLHLGQVRSDSDLFMGLNGVVAPSGERDAAPFVSIRDWPDFEQYYKTIKSKTRKNIRNARNRLTRSGPLDHRTARSGPLLEEVIDRTFDGREAWLGRQGLTSRAFRNTGFDAFLQRFKASSACAVETIAFSLTHCDRPMADQWGFLYKGRYYAFMASWDPAYQEYSPGKLQLGAILEACFEEDLQVADFMIPASDYKLTWAQETIEVQDFVMPISLRGRLHSVIWLNFLRPLAKRIAYSLPTGLRGRILQILILAMH